VPADANDDVLEERRVALEHALAGLKEKALALL
jgi:hypothetical protein